MSDDEAQQRAFTLASTRCPSLGEFLGSRLRRAVEFYGPETNEDDVWIVRYDSRLPEGVAVESPGVLIVEVNDRTGTATLFDSL